jgi:hypothetical protein
VKPSNELLVAYLQLMYKDIMRGAKYIKNNGERFDYIVYEQFMFSISKEDENIVRVHVTADNYEEFVLDKECNSLMLDLILLPNK